jgi:hypothetical protein
MRSVLLVAVAVAITVPVTWLASVVLDPGDSGPGAEPAGAGPFEQSFLERCEAAIYGRTSEGCPELGLPPSEQCQRAFTKGEVSPDCPLLDYPPLGICIPDTVERRGDAWWSSVFQRPLMRTPAPIPPNANVPSTVFNRIITECPE